jgi:hypothetical protein
MDVRTSPLQVAVVKPERTLQIKPYGLDMKVLLTAGVITSGRGVVHHRGHL